MFKAAASIYLLSSTVSANYGPAPQPAPAHNYAPPPSHQHGYVPPPQGSYYHSKQPAYPSVTFPEPLPILNPNQYRDILSLFGQCKKLKCKPDKVFKEDIHESIASIGEYTSCVTGCAAEQIFQTILSYKHALGDVFEIGSQKLVEVRKYLSGESTFDIIGTGTRIDDSCCLPKEQFVKPQDIVIPVEITPSDVDAGNKFSLNNGDVLSASITRMISIQTYLDICSDNGDWESLEIVCNPRWIQYYQLLQHNIGHLILTPESIKTAPPKSCNEYGENNPRADKIHHAVCIAQYSERNNFQYPITRPLIKPIILSRYEESSCPNDIITRGDGEIIDTIVYKRVESGHSPYYVVLDGLPSEAAFDGEVAENESDLVDVIASGDYSKLTCDYTQGLVSPSMDFYTLNAPPSDIALESVKVCPYGGLFEYCNMQQYATYLSKQLFDNNGCEVVDMTERHQDSAASLYTLSCLYKTISLKCDCMEAVLNCYEHQFQFTSALSSTIGKSASVLCGFVLCLKPSVYSLFGGQGAIEKADIMRGLLTQVGISVPSVSSMPPATFAFLAFGVGMIAFVVTKMVSRKANEAISIDNGYAQLI